MTELNTILLIAYISMSATLIIWNFIKMIKEIINEIKYKKYMKGENK